MILDEIAEYTRARVAREKEVVSLAEMREAAHALAEGATADKAQPLPFASALAKPGLSLICEVKKASPSKGIISEDFPYLEIAESYMRGGADAISCLTEPHWFLGSDEIFAEIRHSVTLPMIRKDFVVDPYQIYQAKTLGANAVLLICAILSPAEITSALELCAELELDALVEAHDAKEIGTAINAGAKIIGVNNRNLKDFTVDNTTAANLRELVPKSCLFVAESGIMSIDDAIAARHAGADAILVGEFLMRSTDAEAKVREMRQATC